MADSTASPTGDDLPSAAPSSTVSTRKDDKSRTTGFVTTECFPYFCIDQRSLFFGNLACLIATVAVTNFVLVPVLLQMALYTFPIIYLGSHLSLKQAEVDPVTGEKPNKSDSMNRKDAMLFPVFGSAALLTLYLAYRYLDGWWVNMLLTAYLSLIGTVALAETFYTFLEPFSPQPFLRDAFSFSVSVYPFGSKEEPMVLGGCWLYVGSYVVAIAMSVFWFVTKHWTLHNAFAIAFCIQAIALVAVGDFKVAAILLTGLFVYDIFWVFGTEVMVTVAKSFEGPAKIIFPVGFDPWQQSILGLGDIVIPGIFISMCLRFDNFMHENVLHKKHEKDLHPADNTSEENQTAATTSTGVSARPKSLNEVDIHEKFGKFYFWVVLASYELGLLTTGIVMVIFKHPQPALLYLVPYCLISMFGAATLNGEVKDLLAYKEDDEAKQEVVIEEEEGAQRSEMAKEGQVTDMVEGESALTTSEGPRPTAAGVRAGSSEASSSSS